MFNKTLEHSLNEAFNQAREKRHEFITVEHLLLALLDNPEATSILQACGANLDRLRAGLGIFIDETIPHIPMNLEREIQPTLSFQRVLQRAIYQVQSMGQTEVTGANVLTAIFGEQDSQAVYFLNQENVTRVDVINYLSQGISKPTRDVNFPSDPSSNESSELGHDSSTEESLIDLYAQNLNEKALLGKVDPLIGREDELSRCLQVLCRRTKNNPLFVGEAGVGKTAIAEGLAQMIIDKRVPTKLMRSTVYSLDLGVMLAGTKYRGDFEKRFKAVLKALSKKNGAIIFIDEIHNLIGAGSATGGTMDAANLIKPLLSAGDLRCMGATTYEEYRNFFSKDHALLRRFQKIDIVEPNVDETIKILKGLQQRFEDYHQVSYTTAALVRAVKLSARYITDRHLPDKAIDVIDEAGAYQNLQGAAKRKVIITEGDVEQIIAKMARIPVAQITSTDKHLLKNLSRRLRKMVFGQDQTIEVLARAIKLSRSGLKDPEKPVGSFLMAGPTGVGKTELARQLASELGVELIRFDMSEYMERHSVSRLVGAPPGYVGYEQGGLLTEAVMKQPYAVLLLDEIEKAHPDIFNILLQVMDYGKLTDNNGRKADFRHIIVMMTTNVGAQCLEKHTMGFAEQNHQEDSLAAIKQLFPPEFRNRLDAVLQFKHLNEMTVAKIIDKHLKELADRLKEKGVTIHLSPATKRWLVEKGYDKKMGARPMARVIQEHIKQPIADMILFGDLMEKCSIVEVDVVNDKIEIDICKLRQEIEE